MKISTASSETHSRRYVVSLDLRDEDAEMQFTYQWGYGASKQERAAVVTSVRLTIVVDHDVDPSTSTHNALSQYTATTQSIRKNGTRGDAQYVGVYGLVRPRHMSPLDEKIVGYLRMALAAEFKAVTA